MLSNQKVIPCFRDKFLRHNNSVWVGLWRLFKMLPLFLHTSDRRKCTQNRVTLFSSCGRGLADWCYRENWQDTQIGRCACRRWPSHCQRDILHREEAATYQQRPIFYLCVYISIQVYPTHQWHCRTLSTELKGSDSKWNRELQNLFCFSLEDLNFSWTV